MYEQQKCPDCEKLDEYREGDSSRRFSEHIEDCSECQKKIAAYDMIDARMNAMAQPPEGLAFRIKSAVHSGRGPSIRIYHFWMNPAFRASAAAAVLVILAALAVNVASVKRRDAEAATDTLEISSAESLAQGDELREAQPREIPADGKYRFREFGKKAAQEGDDGAGRQDNLRLASVNDGNNAKKDAEMSAKTLLPTQVRHIWTVEDLGDADAFLKQVSADNSLNFGIDRTDEDIAAQVTLQDWQMQRLVDMMCAKGWKLLSPQLPQPGKEDAVDFVGRKAVYRLMLIRNK